MTIFSSCETSIMFSMDYRFPPSKRSRFKLFVNPVPLIFPFFYWYHLPPKVNYLTVGVYSFSSINPLHQRVLSDKSGFLQSTNFLQFDSSIYFFKLYIPDQPIPAWAPKKIYLNRMKYLRDKLLYIKSK